MSVTPNRPALQWDNRMAAGGKPPAPDFVVIARAPEPESMGCQPGEIILCWLPGNPHHPFVTWGRNDPDRGGDGLRYWGHYHADEQAARADLRDRARGPITYTGAAYG